MLALVLRTSTGPSGGRRVSSSCRRVGDSGRRVSSGGRRLGNLGRRVARERQIVLRFMRGDPDTACSSVTHTIKISSTAIQESTRVLVKYKLLGHINSQGTKR